jgi:hypothetical protein
VYLVARSSGAVEVASDAAETAVAESAVAAANQLEKGEAGPARASVVGGGERSEDDVTKGAREGSESKLNWPRDPLKRLGSSKSKPVEGIESRKWSLNEVALGSRKEVKEGLEAMVW